MDRALVEEILRGKTHRYAVLVDRHKDKAMTLAVRMLQERREAEEAVQDAFVRAYRNLDRFRGDAAFSTWLYRILYNTCVSRLRVRRNQAHWIEWDENSAAVQATQDSSLDDDIEQGRMQEVLEAEVRRLAPAMQSALTLFFVQECTYEEIAAILEIPMGTVKTLLFRGKRLLRQRLEGKMTEEGRTL